MRPKISFMILCGVLLLAMTLILRNTVRHRRAAEASLSASAAQRVGLAAEIEWLKSHNAAGENIRTELTRTLNALSPPRATAAQKSNASPSPARTFSDIIAHDPKMETLMLRRQRAVVLLEYAPLFRALKLSPDQIKQFEDNCVKREESYIDLRAAAREQDDLGKQTVAKLQEQANTDYEAAQLEVLGADGYRQLQEFLRAAPMRNVLILGLAGAAALEGIPLTAEQGEHLLQAALNAASQDTSIRAEKLMATVDWDALDAQARQILSPAQFTLFTTVAAPSGFTGRGKYKTDALIYRALQADAASSAGVATKLPGG